MEIPKGQQSSSCLYYANCRAMLVPKGFGESYIPDRSMRKNWQMKNLIHDCAVLMSIEPDPNL